MKNAVVSLVSGGMDSCTTMAKFVIDGWNVFPLHIRYGQVASKNELKSAKKYIRTLQEEYDNLNGLQVVTMSIPFLKVALTGTTKVSKSTDRDFHSLLSKKVDWVPSRNIIFLSIAASYCEMVKSRSISFGAYREDELPPYPDSSPTFFSSMEDSLNKGIYGDHFHIETPFANSLKSEIVIFSSRNNLPVQYTWSCYEAGSAHCGLCRNCIDRRKAFEKSGIPDPTHYET